MRTQSLVEDVNAEKGVISLAKAEGMGDAKCEDAVKKLADTISRSSVVKEYRTLHHLYGVEALPLAARVLAHSLAGSLAKGEEGWRWLDPVQKDFIKRVMAVAGFRPMLSSGYGEDDPGPWFWKKKDYKMMLKMLATAAKKWNAYILHGSPNFSHSTEFGKLMVGSGIVSACACDRGVCDGVAKNMWNALSIMFVNSFPTTSGKNEFVAAIHGPANQFSKTIMYTSELPAVQSKFHGTFLVANYEKNTKNHQASCAEYSRLLNSFSFSYTCMDCADASMAECEVYAR